MTFLVTSRLCFFIQTPEEEEILNKKRSKKIQKKYDERKKNAKISSLLEEQFQQGKLLGKIDAAVLGAGVGGVGLYPCCC